MESGVQRVPWTPRETFLTLFGALVAVLIIPAALVLPFDPNIGNPDKASDAGVLATQVLFDAILIVIALGVATGWRFDLRQALDRLGVRRFELSGFGWMFLALGCYYAFAIAFSAVVVEPKQQDIGKELGVCNPGIGIAIAAVTAIVVLAPITEELFFRGFVYAGLQSRWSMWPSALVSGALFGLVHAPTGPTAAIPLAALGVALAWLYNKTGSILPGMFAHGLNNALVIAVVIGKC